MQVKHKDQDPGTVIDNDRPLSSAALHILLALAESDLHGYGIMQSVKRQSGGTFKLGPGTLYANLDRLLASLATAPTWRGVFDTTLRCVRPREQALGVAPSEPQASFGAAVRDFPAR